MTKFDILGVNPQLKEIDMTEDQENKLIIAYLQDVIAQMTAYKEYSDLSSDQLVKEAKSY